MSAFINGIARVQDASRSVARNIAPKSPLLLVALLSLVAGCAPVLAQPAGASAASSASSTNTERANTERANRETVRRAFRSFVPR